MNILYLASSSIRRQELLTQAKIPFTLISQSADEAACDWSLPLPQLLKAIALSKMQHAQIPPAAEGAFCFVVTADTMGQDLQGVAYGKPVDRADAMRMIKALRDGGRCGTAFVLDKKIVKNGQWAVHERIIGYAEMRYTFAMPDHWIDSYLENQPDYLHISGAIDVEGYGAQFLKTVHGSYGALSLPLYDLRNALDDLGFFKKGAQ